VHEIFGFEAPPCHAAQQLVFVVEQGAVGARIVRFVSGAKSRIDMPPVSGQPCGKPVHIVMYFEIYAASLQNIEYRPEFLEERGI
tara:strand:- start:1068 stop:1322 length:255 start_codon:yes stop_codon:yes gene_type:complete